MPGTKVTLRDCTRRGFSGDSGPCCCTCRPTTSGFFRPQVFFNGHVPEFAGFKHITTILALNEFSIFLARYNAHTRMPAEFLHKYFWGWSLIDR